jgi:antitoxin VapB
MYIDMVLHIRDPEAERLARELAARAGQPITRVVVEALRAKLQREKAKATFPASMTRSWRSAGAPRRCHAAPAGPRARFSAMTSGVCPAPRAASDQTRSPMAIVVADKAALTQ